MQKSFNKYFFIKKSILKFFGLKNLLKEFFILYFLLTGTQTLAQQTIINVPSSEILPQGDMILKDSNSFNPFSDGGYTSIGPSVIVGPGYNSEISFGTSGNFAEQNHIKGIFTAKKVFFLGGATRLTAGGRISPYFSQSVSPETFIYSHVSTRIRKTKTSLTAGVYAAGHHTTLPNKAGALLGIEQVIIPNKLRLAVDWMSDNESNGILGAGFKFRPVPTLSITSGVLVKDADEDKLSFIISISKFISLKDIKKIRRL